MSPVRREGQVTRRSPLHRPVGGKQRWAWALAIAEGSAWTALAAALAAGGHEPSGPRLLPLAAEDYYAAQALFALPLIVTAVQLQTTVAHRAARRLGADAARDATFLVSAVGTCAPTILLWILPDAIAYAAAGFRALGSTVRIAAPASSVVAWLLCAWGMRRCHGLSPARSALAAAAGLLARALLVGPFLR